MVNGALQCKNIKCQNIRDSSAAGRDYKTNLLISGCSLVVSVLAFYSNNPSSNPADVYSFSVKFVFEKNENIQKEAGVGPFLNKKNKFVWQFAEMSLDLLLLKSPMEQAI